MRHREFTAYVIAIQTVLLASIYFDVPFVRKILGFFYLAFVPGLILMFLLRLDKRDVTDPDSDKNPARTNQEGSRFLVPLLYSIGLGLAFLMFSGVIINYALPAIGIERPLTTYPIFFSISLLVLVSLFFVTRRENDLALAPDIKIWQEVKKHVPITVFLLLLPILSVAGTALMNNTGNNALLLLLIVSIIVFSISTVFLKDSIPAWAYPLAIFTIGISLLSMHSLDTSRLVGYDIHGEYHVFSLTDSSASWSPYLEEGMYRVGYIYAYMTSISITILPVIFQVITGISPEYIFKFVLVSFFSIIPLIVFRIARCHFDRYTSFLSALFFIVLSYFHTQLPMVTRQGIAFVFFALLILALFDTRMGALKRRVLFVVFVFSAILAHYSTAIILFLVLTAFFILGTADRKSRSDKVKSNTVILMAIALFSWQVYTEGVLQNLVKLIKNVAEHLTEFLEPATRGGTVQSLVGIGTDDPVVRVGFYLGTLTRIFIVLGTIFIFFKWRELKIKRDFVLLQIIGLALLFTVVIVPYASKGYNAERVYLQTLIILAPSFVIGGLKIMDLLKVRGKGMKYGIVVLVIVFHFAFQSGLIYQFTGTPQNLALSREGDTYNRLYVHEQDVESARWLGNTARGKPIFTDANGQNILISYGMLPNAKIWTVKADMELFGNPYIYLRYSNIVNGRITLRGGKDSNVNDTNVPYMLGLDITDRVFDNGASRVHRMRTQPLLETAGV
jgi:uncharacterized membrane protein